MAKSDDEASSHNPHGLIDFIDIARLAMHFFPDDLLSDLGEVSQQGDVDEIDESMRIVCRALVVDVRLGIIPAGVGPSLPDHPAVQIFRTKPADRNNSLIAIDITWLTLDCRSTDLVGECEGSRLVATVLSAVLPTKLAALRGIDPVQPNALPANLNRIAIDDTGGQCQTKLA